MKSYSLLLMLLVSILSITATAANSAKKPANTEVWKVDGQRAICEGATTMQCLLVKKQGDKDYNFFYDTIIGFDYKEGFVYTIWVTPVPKAPPVPADASIFNYKLVKVVSKKAIPGYAVPASGPAAPLVSNAVNTKIMTLVVNEDKAPCSGIPENKCLLILEKGGKEFELFYQDIKGFEYEDGVRQTIQVSKRHIENPLVIQTEPVYTFIKVISKERIHAGTKPEKTVADAPLSILDKKWYLRKMRDSDTSSLEIDDDTVWIEFNTMENRLKGKAPCNTYFGGFKTDLISAFQASAIASTKMYCSNMSFEDLYFSNLQNADRYEIKDGRLLLYFKDKIFLGFE